MRRIILYVVVVGGVREFPVAAGSTCELRARRDRREGHLRQSQAVQSVDSSMPSPGRIVMPLVRLPRSSTLMVD